MPAVRITSVEAYPKPGDLNHPDTIRERARLGELTPFPPAEPGILIRFTDKNGTGQATKTGISQMLRYVTKP